MWPSKIARGQARNFNLGTLHFAFEADKHPDTHAMHMPGQSWVLGYAIPPFQRPRVWTVEQSIKFVESCILGLGIGSFTTNNTEHEPTEIIDGIECFHFADRWLIDGQQRLSALKDYWSDLWPVFGLTWGQVDELTKRRFLNSTPFDSFELNITDEAILRDYYDRLSFGGTPHRPEERAALEGDDDAVPTGLGMR